MFQFPRLPPARLCVRREVPELRSGGLPRSETCGSKRVCRSPQIIAACRVLRSLPMPRHPPCARNIFASFALSPALRRGRQFEIKKVFRVSISMFIAIVICEPPAIIRKIDCLENESEGFSLMILTSVNAMQLSRCPAGRKTARRPGRAPGTGDCENEGWGIQALRTLFSPNEANPCPLPGRGSDALPRVGPEGPDFSLERR